MTDLSLHASPNAEVFGRFASGFVVATIGAILMTVVGALNTGQIAFWPRLAYWLIVMELGALIGVGVHVCVANWGAFSGRPAIEAVVVALLIALPLTLIVTGASMIFFGIRAPGFLQTATIFAIVAFISMIITTINYALGRTTDAAAASALPTHANHGIDTADPSASRFSERLPIGLRASTVMALAAEDHYLRVYTDSGDVLILMRLSDAIAELAEADGLQTHRSWWVARAAVRTARRTEGKGLLTLKNGAEAPVSRTYMKIVAAAGWFS